MAFELYTTAVAPLRKAAESKPKGHLGSAGNLYLTSGAVRLMGLVKGSRTDVLIDREANRIALRLGGEDMNGSSRGITVMKNGATFSIKSALKGFGYELPAEGVHLIPSYENGLWIFDLPPSMKAKA